MSTPMMTMSALAALGLAAATAAAGPAFPLDAASVAAGLEAHAVCSAIFVQGVDGAATDREMVQLLAGPAGRPLSFKVDRATPGVDASYAGLAHARADFTPGYGCRVRHPGDAPAPAPSAPTPAPAIDDFAPPGVVSPASPALAAAIDVVFAERHGQPAKQVKAVVVVKDGHVVAERYAAGFGVDTRLIEKLSAVAKSFTNALLKPGWCARSRLRVDNQPVGAPTNGAGPGDPRAGTSPSRTCCGCAAASTRREDDSGDQRGRPHGVPDLGHGGLRRRPSAQAPAGNGLRIHLGQHPDPRPSDRPHDRRRPAGPEGLRGTRDLPPLAHVGRHAGVRRRRDLCRIHLGLRDGARLRPFRPALPDGRPRPGRTAPASAGLGRLVANLAPWARPMAPASGPTTGPATSPPPGSPAAFPRTASSPAATSASASTSSRRSIWWWCDSATPTRRPSPSPTTWR